MGRVTERLQSTEALQRFVGARPLTAVYFTGPDCAVCAALKPKLKDLLNASFPALALADVDCAASREVAAQQSVFAIPTLLVFVDGRESFRQSRSINLAELRERLSRPYSVLFGD